VLLVVLELRTGRVVLLSQDIEVGFAADHLGTVLGDDVPDRVTGHVEDLGSRLRLRAAYDLGLMDELRCSLLYLGLHRVSRCLTLTSPRLGVIRARALKDRLFTDKKLFTKSCCNLQQNTTGLTVLVSSKVCCCLRWDKLAGVSHKVVGRKGQHAPETNRTE